MSTGPFPVATAMARLSSHAPLLAVVGNAADLGTALAQKPNRVPAAYVVTQERGGAVKYTGPVTHQNVDVSLQIVLFVRNAGGERAGTGARAEMDAVIAQVRAALIGWAPDDATNAVTFQAGRDERYDGGCLVTQQVFRSDYRYANQVMP